MMDGETPLATRQVRVEPGEHEVPPSSAHRLFINCGPAIYAAGEAGGVKSARRLQSPGDIDLVPAGVWGRWVDEEQTRVMVVSIAPQALLLAARKLGLAEPNRLAPRLSFRDERLVALARLLPEEAEARQAHMWSSALAPAITLRLLTGPEEGFQPTTQIGARLSARRLRDLLTYIEDNLEQDLTLPRLAQHARIGRSQLVEAFRRAVGQTPRQYILHRRVQAARRLLEEDRIPISEIALRTGFSHQSHLSNTMKRLTGCTPAEVMRAAQSGPSAGGATSAATSAPQIQLSGA